jgi:hypothetical protein
VRALGLIATLAVAACSGCGPTSASPRLSPPPTTVHHAADGVTVTVSARRAIGSGRTVHFTISARASEAPGALHYGVAYGDGQTAANTTPLFCRAGRGGPEHQTWTLAHTYATAGPYTVTAAVGVTCSSHRAGVTLRVNP